MSNANDTASPETRNPRQADGSPWGSTIAIILVATLVFFLVNGPGPNASNRENVDRTSIFSASAFLSGINRHISSPDFRGASLSTFLGGIDLDLRDATMEGDEVRIDVSTFMGGVSLRVPQSWTVVNHVNTFIGGFDDHTHPSDSNKRLVLDGSVFMGGLEIKN